MVDSVVESPKDKDGTNRTFSMDVLRYQGWIKARRRREESAVVAATLVAVKTKIAERL